MRCPFCGELDSRVIDSRPADEGNAIRRRRECVQCLRRFTTYEKVEETPLIVVKKDGRREVFSRDKLLNGLLKACEKRPVSLDQLQRIVNQIEQSFRNDLRTEVLSAEIGEMSMEALRGVDAVAYVRFASVYRQFTDVESFRKELERLHGEDPNGNQRP
jgi:transcriptional repressor NrdR